MSDYMRRCGDCKHFEHERWCCLLTGREKGFSSIAAECFEDGHPELTWICRNCEYFGGVNTGGSHFKCLEEDAIWTCYLPVRRNCNKLSGIEPGETFHEFSFLKPNKLNRKIVRLP